MVRGSVTERCARPKKAAFAFELDHRHNRARLSLPYCAAQLPHIPPSIRQAEMIRRDPTLITMSDNDVQAVRNMVAQKKAAAAAAAGGKGKDAALPTPYSAVDEQKKQREAMSRDERLGLAN